MDDFERLIKVLSASDDPMYHAVKALVIHLNDMRRQLDALEELQEIKVELQSNNKALQSMIAELMELLSKLQPNLQTGLTEYQVARMLKNDRMEREAIVFRNFLSTIPVLLFCDETGEITSIVMKEEPK